jgi:hypothetical protein
MREIALFCKKKLLQNQILKEDYEQYVENKLKNKGVTPLLLTKKKKKLMSY